MLAALAGILVGLVLAEVGLRVVARCAGRPHDSAAERAALERLVAEDQQYNPTFRGTLPAIADGPREGPKGEEAQALRMLHPFTAWETVPGMDLTARLAGPERRDEKPPPFRILLLGGSVAAMFARLGSDRLAERLAADPKLQGRAPELWSFGRTGGKQPQQLMTVAWLFTLGVVPDVVIDLDGHNEVAVGSENASRGTHPLYPSIPHWAALALVGAFDRDVIRSAARTLDVREEIRERAKWALDMGTWRSELGTALTRARLRPLQAELTQLHERYFAAIARSEASGILHGPPFDADPARVIEQSVAGWERDSRMIDELCRTRGVLYLHVLQPSLYDPAGKEPTPRELSSATVLDVWKRAVQAGYPLLRAAGRRLMEQGVQFVDASDLFVGVEGDVFTDYCHFAERGNEILADRLAREILAALR